MPTPTTRHGIDKPLGNENFTRAAYNSVLDEIDVAIPLPGEGTPLRREIAGTGLTAGTSGEVDVSTGAATLVAAPAGGRYRMIHTIHLSHYVTTTDTITLRTIGDTGRILNAYSTAAKELISLQGLVLPSGVGLEVLGSAASRFRAAADWIDMAPRSGHTPLLAFSTPAADTDTTLVAAGGASTMTVIESLWVHNPDGSAREISVRAGTSGSYRVDGLSVPAGGIISIPTPILLSNEALQVKAAGSAAVRFSASGITVAV
jgi:hypothetical protein